MWIFRASCVGSSPSCGAILLPAHLLTASSPPSCTCARQAGKGHIPLPKPLLHEILLLFCAWEDDWAHMLKSRSLQEALVATEVDASS